MPIYLSRKLYHNTPAWVPDTAIFHVRIRSHTCLTSDGIGRKLLDSASLYKDKGIWSCYLMVLMPDHLHALLSFGLDRGMKATIQSWKHYHAAQNGIKWQDGFFDHRIRSNQEYTRSYDYILDNPVRQKICKKPEDWSWRISAFYEETTPHF